MSGAHRWHAERATLAMGDISAALAAQPMSRLQLIDLLDYTSSRVVHYVRRMHKQRLIHIVKWLKRECGHGAFMPVFASGPGIDAPKPKAKTRAQVARDVRRKIKSDPVRRVDYLQKARARETRRGRVKAKPDAWMAQFAGIFGNRQQEAA